MDVSVDEEKTSESHLSLRVVASPFDVEAAQVRARIELDLRGGAAFQSLPDGADRSFPVLLREGETLADACLPRDPLSRLTLRNLAFEALSSHDADCPVVGHPSFGSCKRSFSDGSFSFSVRWARVPQLELSSYEPVVLPSFSDEPTDEEVWGVLLSSGELYDLLAKAPGAEPADEIGLDTVALVSMRCWSNGLPLPAMGFEDRVFCRGSKVVPPVFDKALAGARAGDVVTVSLTSSQHDVDGVFPDQEGVVGEVSVKSVARLPGGEAFWLDSSCGVSPLEKVRGVPGFAALRDRSCDEIREQKARRVRRALRYEVAQALASRVTSPIPSEVYEALVEQMEEDSAEGAFGGVDAFRRRAMLFNQASCQIRQGAALDAWARHRGLALVDGDLDVFFRASTNTPEEADLMRREAEREGSWHLARRGALRLKASEDAVSSAVFADDRRA